MYDNCPCASCRRLRDEQQRQAQRDQVHSNEIEILSELLNLAISRARMTGLLTEMRVDECDEQLYPVFSRSVFDPMSPRRNICLATFGD